MHASEAMHKQDIGAVPVTQSRSSMTNEEPTPISTSIAPKS